MIEKLSLLADDIAALRQFGDQSGDGLVHAMATQFTKQLEHALDEALENPDVFEATMPWWNERTAK